MLYDQQLRRMEKDQGFIAALDQSGGSTPKALNIYGVPECDYSTDTEMFEIMHSMRCRIMESSRFEKQKIIGAILFEDTVKRKVAGLSAPDYLWETKGIVPFLKIDKGILPVDSGVQLMKNIDNINETLELAKSYPILGTKMRSVIHEPDPNGIKNVVDQQFDLARRILDNGLVPIIEPEININSSHKRQCEKILIENLSNSMNSLAKDEKIILKLTLPETPNFYSPLFKSSGVARIVALSGGYSRKDANSRLSRNQRVIASFSRALTEGLNAGQDQIVFDAVLGASIDEIYAASVA